MNSKQKKPGHITQIFDPAYIFLSIDLQRYILRFSFFEKCLVLQSG